MQERKPDSSSGLAGKDRGFWLGSLALLQNWDPSGKGRNGWSKTSLGFLVLLLIVLFSGTSSGEFGDDPARGVGEREIGWAMSRRRQWYPTPVLLLGKSHGRRSLLGCSPWGR